MKGSILVAWLLAIVTAGGLTAAGQECPPAGGLNFVCGPVAVEDLVRVPGTHWIIGSGMAGKGRPGKLHLIDADRKTWEILYPGLNPQNELDAGSYSACPGPPDAASFGAHGIALRDDGKRRATLLAVNHGREAVEVFKLDAAGAKPVIRWVGCVPMTKDVYLNSLAFLPEGGFVATKFFDPSKPEGSGAIFAHKLTGGLLQWLPKTGVTPIAGTDLTGANGIEVSKDGKSIYVAAWGAQELVRFSRKGAAVEKTVVKVDFWPDNLRWAADGTIMVAGQNVPAGSSGGMPTFKGWTVVRLDPATMKVTQVFKDGGTAPLQNVSVALSVDGTLWFGTFAGDRLGYKPLK